MFFCRLWAWRELLRRCSEDDFGGRVVEISGSTRSTLLHGKIHPKDWQVASPLVMSRVSPIFFWLFQVIMANPGFGLYRCCSSMTEQWEVCVFLSFFAIHHHRKPEKIWWFHGYFNISWVMFHHIFCPFWGPMKLPGSCRGFTSLTWHWKIPVFFFYIAIKVVNF